MSRVPKNDGRLRQPTPDWWKDLLRVWLAADPDHDQQTLERRIGASEGAISKLLLTGMRSSAMVDDICRVTGLPHPSMPRPTELGIRVLHGFDALSPENQQLVWAMIRAFSRGEKP